MPELRWSLLILGLLFLVGLAVWELRKQRRSGTSALGSSTAAEDRGDAAITSTGREEPSLDLGAMRLEREPLPLVPVIEIDASVTPHTDPNAAPAEADEVLAMSAAPAGVAVATQSAADRAAAWLAEAPVEAQARPLVLEWPPEDRRQIVALRLVPRAGEQFTGAALRQALTGEGFRHGDFDIFHRPLSDGRVIVSAASLTRPGSFLLAQMDAQLYPGISLFCVLPGPLPSRDSLERLLLVGRTLAQRIGGQLLDSRGQALTEARLLELRRQVAAIPSASYGGGEPPQAAASA